MASKKKPLKPVKSNRIFQWVEQKDPELAQAIKDLCMEGALFPGKGSVGVTFLFPLDTTIRNEIIEKAYGADQDEASKILRGLIIPDALKAAADWKKPVGNLDGVAYKVKSSTGSTVVLAGDSGDAKLERADDFHMLAQRAKEERSAIWNLVSGRPSPGGTEEYKRPKRPEKKDVKPRVKDGSGLYSRKACAMKVEADFCLAMEQKLSKSCNPYLSKVAGLLAFLQRHHVALFNTVLPILDWSPEVSFYLLLEPYKTSGEYLIPDDVLFGPAGWNGSVGFDPVTDFKSFLNSESKGSEVTRNAIEIVRRHINDNPGKTMVPATFVAAYTTLMNKNTVGSVTPILPDETMKKLEAPGYGKKVWQDELRCCLTYSFMGLYRGPIFDKREFFKLVDGVRGMPGNKYDRSESKLLRIVEDLKKDVSPNADYGFLIKFINSTAFLYVAAPEKEVGEPLGDFENPKDATLCKIDAFSLARLNRLTIAAKTSLSPGVLAEARAYIEKFGQLPDEISGLIKK